MVIVFIIVFKWDSFFFFLLSILLSFFFYLFFPSFIPPPQAPFLGFILIVRPLCLVFRGVGVIFFLLILIVKCHIIIWQEEKMYQVCANIVSFGVILVYYWAAVPPAIPHRRWLNGFKDQIYILVAIIKIPNKYYGFLVYFFQKCHQNTHWNKGTILAAPWKCPLPNTCRWMQLCAPIAYLNKNENVREMVPRQYNPIPTDTVHIISKFHVSIKFDR